MCLGVYFWTAGPTDCLLSNNALFLIRQIFSYCINMEKYNCANDNGKEHLDDWDVNIEYI